MKTILLEKNCLKCNNFFVANYETRKFCDINCRNQFYVGVNNPFYGKKHTEEAKKKISAVVFTEERRQKLRELMLGKKLRLGYKASEESKEKNRLAHLGIPSWNKGGKLSPVHCEKLSISHMGKTGEKSSNWKGGFNFNFIRLQRKRVNGGFHTFVEWNILKAQYNWTCPCCKKMEPEITLVRDHVVALSKGGSDNIENIQPLCRSCNAKKHTKFIRYEVSLKV